MTRAILQFFIRLLLGILLLPLVWSAFLVFSVVAACSDKQVLSLRWVLSRAGRLGMLGWRRSPEISPVEVQELASEVRTGS